MQGFLLNHCKAHKREASLLCTECPDSTLVCDQCLPHSHDLLSISVFTDSVSDLMRKKIQFQACYGKACDNLLTEYKKFKTFKLHLINTLNEKQKVLNSLVKKTARIIPYEREKQLFKRRLNYVYLSTNAINPNYQLYAQFDACLKETVKECKNSIHKFVVSLQPIPLLSRKQSQICNVIKKYRIESVSEINYIEPTFKHFKKQTIKCLIPDSKLVRISNEEIISYTPNKMLIHNVEQFAMAKILPINEEICQMGVLANFLFLTKASNEIMLYDIFTEKIIKSYASTKHKEAEIDLVLPIDNNNILNCISCPNQIVSLHLNEQNSLKMSVGVEVAAKCLCIERMDECLYVFCEDRHLRTYRLEHLQKVKEYEFEERVHSLVKMDQNTLLVVGDNINILDRRAKNIVSKINLTHPVKNAKKIYPTSLVMTTGQHVCIYDCKMQKEVIKLEDNAKYIEVVNNCSFVTSGKTLNYYQGL